MHADSARCLSCTAVAAAAPAMPTAGGGVEKSSCMSAEISSEVAQTSIRPLTASAQQ
jgi:hypothetical protein